jgi:hypothetical protein
MTKGVAMLGASLLLVAAGTSMAQVNCKQVNKYLGTGRSVKDVAETMVISESEVRKCQEQAGEAKPAEGAKAGEMKGGEAGGSGEKK